MAMATAWLTAAGARGPLLLSVVVSALLLAHDAAAANSNSSTVPPPNATTSSPFFPEAQAHATYDLQEMLQNLAVYLGVATALLLVYGLVNWSRKVARCFAPRWFNATLPKELVSGTSAPSKEQVVDAILESDPAAPAIPESDAEAAMRAPPPCRDEVKGAGRCGCCFSRGGAGRGCLDSATRCKFGFFSWLWTPWVTTELEFVTRAGLDGYLLFRVMRLLVGFAAATLVLTIGGVLPVYWTQSYPCPMMTPPATTGIAFQNLSSCNVTEDPVTNNTCSCGFLARVALDAGSNASVMRQQIAAVVAQALLSLMFVAAISKEFAYWMKVRRAYCETAPPEIYSVMVRFIPTYLRSEVRLRQFFEDLYPGMVHSVNFCPAEGTKLGVFGLVPKLEHVRLEIARERGINQAFRDLEARNVRCVRCRDPTQSMESLRDKETKVLAAIRRAWAAHAHAVEAVAKAEPPPEHAYHLPAVDEVFNGEAVPWARHRYAVEQERRAQRRRVSEVDRRLASGRMRGDSNVTESGVTDGDDGDNENVDNGDNGGAVEADALELYSYNAFVTFKSAVVALSCSRDTVVAAASQMELLPARQPRDVRWEKIPTHRPGGSKAVDAFVAVMFLLLLIFWGALVFLVGAYTTPQSIACLVNPNCSTESTDNPDDGLSSFEIDLIAIISPLFLQVLSALAKPVISILAKLKFTPFNSDVDRDVFVQFWIFQVLQNFLFFSVSATLFSKLVVYIQQPLELLSDIARTIPEGATFYIIFIGTEILFTLTFQMFRLVWNINFLLRLALCGCRWPMSTKGETTVLCGTCGTPAMVEGAGIGTPLIRLLFIFLLVNAYAVLQPLISVIGLVYALLAFVVYTHQTLAFGTQMFDTGGLYWREIYKVLLACVIIPQVVLLSILLLSKNTPLSIVQGVVVVATCIASFVIYQPHRRDVKAYPLNLASKIDASRVSASKKTTLDRAEQQLLRSRATTAASVSRGGTPAPAVAAAVDSSGRIAVPRSPQNLVKPLLAADYGVSSGGGGGGGGGGKGTAALVPRDPKDMPTEEEARANAARLNAAVVVIPPHVWRFATRPVSTFVMRSYLVPATGADVVCANEHVVRGIRAELEAGDGASKEQAREQLLAATFVYDYTHPTLRAARNVVVEQEADSHRWGVGTAAAAASDAAGGDGGLSPATLELSRPVAPGAGESINVVVDGGFKGRGGGVRTTTGVETVSDLGA